LQDLVLGYLLLLWALTDVIECFGHLPHWPFALLLLLLVY
jgi:hypothetical protein